MTYSPTMLTEEQKRQFDQEGYLIVKGLFDESQIRQIEDAFEAISNTTIAGYFEPDLTSDTVDPLKRYPRVMHPHRFNDTAKKYMLHTPVLAVLEDLYEEAPLAAQSMFYYKPPGARGQALHQDNFYLKVEPGNCIAAWTAIDAADEENGGLMVVPKTQDYDLVCPDSADAKESFTAPIAIRQRIGSAGRSSAITRTNQRHGSGTIISRSIALTGRKWTWRKIRTEDHAVLNSS